MQPLPPTNRLSPKNQVTLPREARALAGKPEMVRALMHWMPGRRDQTVRHPVVVMMTEDELRRRERAIIANTALPPAHKTILVQDLNLAATLALDDQRRVVIPAHLIEYIGLARDALFVSTNDLIYLWNPDEFRRWSEPAASADTPDLSAFILV